MPTAKAAYVIHMKNTTFTVLTFYSFSLDHISVASKLPSPNTEKCSMPLTDKMVLNPT
jgi:hypothetical protein